MFSGWLAATAVHRLRLEAGREAMAAWEKEYGPLTAEEVANGLPGTRRARAPAPSRRSAFGLMAGVTYDTGALLAAERNDRSMLTLHAGFLAEEIVPTEPAPVIAEAWRGGGRQASLFRLLDVCEIEAMNEDRARGVGVLAGKAGHDDIAESPSSRARSAVAMPSPPPTTRTFEPLPRLRRPVAHRAPVTARLRTTCTFAVRL